MNYRKIFCCAILALFTFSSALCMKSVHASTPAETPKTLAASARVIPVLNYVPNNADTILFLNLKNLLSAKVLNDGVAKQGKDQQLQIAKSASKDFSLNDIEGELVIFAQSSQIQNGSIEVKQIFNSPKQNVEKILNDCETSLKNDQSNNGITVKRGTTANAQNYLLLQKNEMGKNISVLLTAASPYQLQVTVSNSNAITPAVFPITRNPSKQVEELKAIKDQQLLILAGNLHNCLPVIGKWIPHSPKAKYIRSISDYSLKLAEKEEGLHIDLSVDFMLDKYCEDINKHLETIKSLLPADKKITYTNEIKNKNRLVFSVTGPAAEIQKTFTELSKYFAMDQDDLDRQIKEKEKKEKREKAMKAQKAKQASASSTSSSPGLRRPGMPPPPVD